ncbi:hypothetical protein M8C13_10930 [Crossiella sp. SN42]|uniref:hypothetical protein n=1 Tax=Crossiella sp. SN42 TaxID=2944808 RepID=UPI00207D4BE8|nr:hypothetical protein [Crossiella sp. SN42]MCO1576266.1 hypothetical protein [Crossiella sp. SN42]
MTRTGELDPRMVTALPATRPRPVPDEVDQRLIALLRADGRPGNLLVSVVCRDGEDLYDLITGPLGALPEVTGVDVTPVLHVARRAGVSHSA